MQEFEVLFYDAADGTEPAKEFILGLDTKMRAKVLRTVQLTSRQRAGLARALF